MKKILIKTALIAAAALPASCDLDINKNPNDATAEVVTPDLVLPVAVAALVYDQVYYYGRSTAAYLVGYQVPGEGIGGYGDVYTYNFTSKSFTGVWTETFACLRNFNTIIKTSEADPQYALYGGIARVLKAYCYHLLADAYGDVPYTEGLRGESNLSPAFDKDAAVYRALFTELDDAIAILKANKDKAGGNVLGLNANNDPVFGGDCLKWIQFANNIKLRLLVRSRGTSIDVNNFVKSAFAGISEEGFLTEDVLANPGYNASGQQNPYWTVYHSSVIGAIAYPALYYIASSYVLSFYDGTKLADAKRGALVYKGWPDVRHYQLGNQSGRPYTTGYTWYIGTGTGQNASDAAGILKSRSAPAPLFFAFETYFLLAEAALYDLDPAKAYTENAAKAYFENGIKASFDFLERVGAANSLPAGANPQGDAEAYIAANSMSPLANFDLAATREQKLEAIITQKYIASNILNSNEAWNEFRRTGYPAISGTGSRTTFASVQSSSPRADKLPVRLIYPQSEYNLNVNTPKLANSFSNPIFWDRE
ncbi:MAG: SusD/RagB family nutrient-binding outer membrane lipoprotein [Prevotellaceae bacterium]|jgi:hypothetical protein|nr:SusD/RagB family nutrient-binding outer membrane lipoprotein [Prevotellaceae bacterium]